NVYLTDNSVFDISDNTLTLLPFASSKQPLVFRYFSFLSFSLSLFSFSFLFLFPFSLFLFSIRIIQKLLTFRFPNEQFLQTTVGILSQLIGSKLFSSSSSSSSSS